MHARPVFMRPHYGLRIVAASLSILVTVGLLAGLVGALQSAGAPFERVAIAERACTGHSFESERKACVISYLAQFGLQGVVASR